jgi:iron complex transport system substrate-binding protein
VVAGVVKTGRVAPPLVLAVLVCTLAAAVEHFVPPDAGQTINRATTVSVAAKVRTGTLDYPRTAVDSDSFAVHVARPARRIVSQYWSIDEYVYSLVPPERVVAVSESAYLPNISNVYSEVQEFHPAIATDPERVLRLDPDLLLVSNGSRADFCALVRSTHLPIYRVFTTFTTLAQVAETIRLTGYLTGEDRAATDEVNRFWSEIQRAQSHRKPDVKSPRILGLSGHSSYGTETLFDDIVRTLGGINVGAEAGLKGYDAINTEQIVHWNPEWIISGADHGKTAQVLSTLLTDPAIATTQAARDGHILVFDFNVFLPTSPFTIALINAIAEAIYE